MAEFLELGSQTRGYCAELWTVTRRPCTGERNVHI